MIAVVKLGGQVQQTFATQGGALSVTACCATTLALVRRTVDNNQDILTELLRLERASSLFCIRGTASLSAEREQELREHCKEMLNGLPLLTGRPGECQKPLHSEVAEVLGVSLSYFSTTSLPATPTPVASGSSSSAPPAPAVDTLVARSAANLAPATTSLAAPSSVNHSATGSDAACGVPSDTSGNLSSSYFSITSPPTTPTPVASGSSSFAPPAPAVDALVTSSAANLAPAATSLAAPSSVDPSATSSDAACSAPSDTSRSTAELSGIWWLLSQFFSL